VAGAFSVHGSNEQIFGADEQNPRTVTKRLLGVRPTSSAERGQGRTDSLTPALLMAGAFLLYDTDEQMFGAK
jgi:hypothetical protein